MSRVSIRERAFFFGNFYYRISAVGGLASPINLLCSTRARTSSPYGGMADRQKFKALYAKAKATCDRWGATQSRAGALFASAVSIISRLPLLEDAANFGALAGEFSGLPEQTRVAQAEALHRVLESLCQELVLFDTLCVALEKIAKDALALITFSKPANAGAVRLGPISSPAEAVAGLQDLWRLHKDELSLKTALCKELTNVDTGNTSHELEYASVLFRKEPNLDPGEIDAILDRGETLGAVDAEFSSPRKAFAESNSENASSLRLSRMTR